MFLLPLFLIITFIRFLELLLWWIILSFCFLNFFGLWILLLNLIFSFLLLFRINLALLKKLIFRSCGLLLILNRLLFIIYNFSFERLFLILLRLSIFISISLSFLLDYPSPCLDIWRGNLFLLLLAFLNRIDNVFKLLWLLFYFRVDGSVLIIDRFGFTYPTWYCSTSLDNIWFWRVWHMKFEIIFNNNYLLFLYFF